MIQIDLSIVIPFILRVGIVLLAFYLGTKYFLLNKNFENFAMYAIFRTCKEIFPRCEENCPYYSTKEQCCLLQNKAPKDWVFTSLIGRIKRKDA
jgi:hypothetical protein